MRWPTSTGARQAILDGGGTVDEVEQFDFGTCAAPPTRTGTSFARLPAESWRSARPELNGTGPGELSYITYEVTDSAAFKAFYSRVLYWTFEPGRIDDGWQVEQTHPMAGVAGGSAQPVTVPMWTVEDIDAAVARVREAGGTVIDEPSQQPYGQIGAVHRRPGHAASTSASSMRFRRAQAALSATLARRTR